jgi:hypothetical protein
VSERGGGDQWKPRLLKAVSHEGQQVGGFGRVLFEVTYSDGLPLEVRVVERHPLYRLDRDCAIDSRPAAR